MLSYSHNRNGLILQKILLPWLRIAFSHESYNWNLEKNPDLRTVLSLEKVNSNKEVALIIPANVEKSHYSCKQLYAENITWKQENKINKLQQVFFVAANCIICNTELAYH